VQTFLAVRLLRDCDSRTLGDIFRNVFRNISGNTFFKDILQECVFIRRIHRSAGHTRGRIELKWDIWIRKNFPDSS